MKLGIMQPYFFPYIGYFQLINATERWVVFDNVQYIRHGWVNRNRILKPCKQDWQYIIVPLAKHPRDVLIKDVKTINADWRGRILMQLEHYKKIAPFYSTVLGLVKRIFDIKSDNLCVINTYALAHICNYLKINFNYSFSSEIFMNKEKNIVSPSDWALNISKYLGADCYINPISGSQLFNKDDYKESHIDIKFLKVKNFDNQNNIKCNQLIHNLSIIDVMMFNSPEEIREMLRHYELV